MTADSKKQDKASDDIDLVVFIERAILFFGKYKWIFIIAVVVGLSLGIFAYNSLPNTYKSRLVAHSLILTNQDNIQIVQNWNELLVKEEYAELSARLNCPEPILHNLKKISAEEIQKVASGTNPHGFIITVNITDNAILDELEKGIIYGFENSPYIKERLTNKRADLGAMIEKTSIEIQKLDSTKKMIENIIGGKNKSSSSVIIDGATINRQLIEMNERLLGYKEGLKFTGAIHVLQGFSKFRKPADPNLLPWLAIGLLLLLPIAFLLALFHSIKQKIKMRARSQP